MKGRMTNAVTSRAAHVTGPRAALIIISAVTGTCFAVLAGLSLSAIVTPFRRVHVFSFVIAIVSIGIAYLSIRAAKAGRTGKGTAAASLASGIIGALIGLLAMMAILIMFRPDAQSSLAHALGQPASGFTTTRLMVAAVLLGFGTGVVSRIPRSSR
jgi:uncharacterized membrane protein